MDYEIKINNFTISISGMINSIQHSCNTDALARIIINDEKVDKDYFGFEQQVLVNFNLRFSFGENIVVGQIEYQILLERSFQANSSYGFSDEGTESCKCTKHIIRLTHFSEYKNQPEFETIKNIIQLIDSQNLPIADISEDNFFNFGSQDLLSFKFSSLEECEFGLFITRVNNGRSEGKSYKRIITTSNEYPQWNSFSIELLPLGSNHLYGDKISDLGRSLYEFQRRKRNCDREPYIAGDYFDLKKIFENERHLSSLVMQKVKDEFDCERNNRSAHVRDNTDWSQWNDDLDADQQSPDFWNQF